MIDVESIGPALKRTPHHSTTALSRTNNGGRSGRPKLSEYVSTGPVGEGGRGRSQISQKEKGVREFQGARREGTGKGKRAPEGAEREGGTGGGRAEA